VRLVLLKLFVFAQAPRKIKEESLRLSKKIEGFRGARAKKGDKSNFF
jgi:hypothetical protein